MNKNGVYTYKDNNLPVVVVLVGGRASIRIGSRDAFLVDDRYDLSGFFDALGKNKEINGLSSVLQSLKTL